MPIEETLNILDSEAKANKLDPNIVEVLKKVINKK